MYREPAYSPCSIPSCPLPLLSRTIVASNTLRDASSGPPYFRVAAAPSSSKSQYVTSCGSLHSPSDRGRSHAPPISCALRIPLHSRTSSMLPSNGSCDTTCMPQHSACWQLTATQLIWSLHRTATGPPPTHLEAVDTALPHIQSDTHRHVPCHCLARPPLAIQVQVKASAQPPLGDDELGGDCDVSPLVRLHSMLPIAEGKALERVLPLGIASLNRRTNYSKMPTKKRL